MLITRRAGVFPPESDTRIIAKQDRLGAPTEVILDMTKLLLSDMASESGLVNDISRSLKGNNQHRRPPIGKLVSVLFRVRVSRANERARRGCVCQCRGVCERGVFVSCVRTSVREKSVCQCWALAAVVALAFVQLCACFFLCF